MATWFDEQLELYRHDPEFMHEGVLLSVNEQIVRWMQACGIKRSELAGRLGVSRAAVTRMLSGHPNITIKTLCKVASALGLDVNVQLALPDVAENVIVSFGRPITPPPAIRVKDNESAVAA